MISRVINNLAHTATDLRERISSRGVILMYHSVADIDTDPWNLAVSPQHFAEQLAFIRENYHPLSLKQYGAALKEGTLPRRAIVITFDDGYANNFHLAKPILEQFDIPATVFVTTGYTGQNREFWWDALDQIFLQPADLPVQLSVEINGEQFSRTLRDPGPDEREFVAGPPRDDSISRSDAYGILWERLIDLPGPEITRTIEALFQWAGKSPSARETHRPLTEEEIVSLADGGLIEIGAHTVTHPNLPRHPLSVQREEIQRNKSALEDVVGSPIESFSYPYGRHTPETAALVKSAGYQLACAASAEMTRKSDLYVLPRFGIGNLDGERFARMTSDWFRFYSYPRPLDDFVINLGRRTLPPGFRKWLWDQRDKARGSQTAP